MSKFSHASQETLLLGTFTREQVLRMRKEAYDQLKADGFSDIERTDNNEPEVFFFRCSRNIRGRQQREDTPWTARPSYLHRSRDRLDRDDTDEQPTVDLMALHQAYFTRCLHFLHSASRRRPKGRTERSVWRLYADGMTVRFIAAELDLDPTKVWRVIKRLELRMQEWWDASVSDREAERDERAREP